MISQSDLQELRGRLPEFLSSFAGAYNNSQHIRYGHYLKLKPHDFLARMKNAVERSQVLRQREAPFFNPFTVLDIERRELVATALWKDLLDPNGKHDQCDLFLKPLLEYIDNKIQNQSPEKFSSYSKITPVSSWKTSAEYFVQGVESGDRDGRIDVYLEHEDTGSAIAIEYKIDAKDQEHQVRRYYSHLKNNTNLKQFQVVYINPTGTQPSKSSLDTLPRNEVVCLSIQRELVGVLKKVIRENDHLPTKIHEFIECYIEVAKQ